MQPTIQPKAPPADSSLPAPTLATKRTGHPADPPQLRIVVLSVPFGGGHRAVAEAVTQALQRRGLDGPVVELLDALDVVSRRINLKRLGRQAYFAITRPRLRRLYRALFAVADRHPHLFGRLSYALFGGRTRSWLRASQPEVVVSTFPFVTYCVGQSIRREGLTTRLVTLVTDGGRVNRTWFAGSIDVIAVTDDESEREAHWSPTLGQVVRIDLPLRSEFYRYVERSTARRSLDLGSEPVVLIWGGGQGLAAGILGFAQELCRQDLPMTPIFVTGTNRRLARQLADVPWRGRALILGQRSDIRHLLAAADTVVGKAGWISLSEAAALGLHTVCIDALPGQEYENLRVFCAQGAASWIPDPPAAVAKVWSLVTKGRPTEESAAAPSRRPALCDVVQSLAILSRTAQAGGSLDG